jgi:sugar phosphate permease
LVSTFELSGIFGSILSGILTDYIYSYRMKIYKNINKEGQKPESIRIRMALVRYYMIGLFFFFKLFNLTLDKAMSTWLLVIIGFMNGFLTYGSISILGVIAMEFTSKSLSGTSHAIAAFSANMGSIFAGVPFAIFSKLYSWQYAFNMIEIPIFMTALFMIILRKTKTNFEPLTNTERKKK